MKRPLLLLAALLSVTVLAGARTFPPVVVSADVDRDKPEAPSSTQRYALYVAPYEEFGSVAASSQKPPSSADVARLIEAALPADRYVPIANKSESPDLVIGVQWGEVSPSGPQPFIGAREGGVVKPMWAITVGRTKVPPFLTSSEWSQLNDEMRRDHYYLLISAYDPAALRDGRVKVLWQTRTSIDSLQAPIDQAWSYLAGAAQNNLAKRILRPAFVSDAPKLTASTDATPVVPIDEVIPGASKLLTFEKAMPPY